MKMIVKIGEYFFKLQPECDHAKTAEMCLYLMYPLLLLELIVFLCYFYLKRQQSRNFSDEKDAITLASTYEKNPAGATQGFGGDAVAGSTVIMVAALPTFTTPTDATSIVSRVSSRVGKRIFPKRVPSFSGTTGTEVKRRMSSVEREYRGVDFHWPPRLGRSEGTIRK